MNVAVSQYLSRKLRFLGFAAILMVVQLHAWNLHVQFAARSFELPLESWPGWIESLATGSLTRVAVPLFFLLSGYLFFLTLEPTRRGFALKMRRRLSSLLVPYLVWSGLGLAAYALMQSMPGAENYFTRERILSLPPSQVVHKLLVDPVPYQFWFIRELLKYIVLAPGIFGFVRYVRLPGILVIAVAWLFGYSLPHFNSDGLFFFVLGAYFGVRHTPVEGPGWQAGRLCLCWMVFAAADATWYVRYGRRFFPLHNASILVGLATLWAGYDRVARYLMARGWPDVTTEIWADWGCGEM